MTCSGGILGLRHDMDVIGPHVRGQQRPSAALTNLAQRLERDCASVLVEHIRRLPHPLKF
ncbi:MAG: hypothetical protein ACLQBJ_18340 [Bryobacteraceae bacterium]